MHLLLSYGREDGKELELSVTAVEYVKCYSSFGKAWHCNETKQTCVVPPVIPLTPQRMAALRLMSLKRPERPQIAAAEAGIQ